MKTINKFLISILFGGALVGCQNDVEGLKTTDVGPVMSVVSADSNGYFGGVVDYSVSLDDPIALSTLTAQILFDDEVVAEEVTRTTENGTYEGTLSIPYTANTPNGDAVLRFVGQNIEFGTTTITQTLSVSRAIPSTITFNLDGAEYTMNQVEGYNYAVTDYFDQKAEGYITIDDVDGKGSSVNLGYSSTEGSIVADSTEGIPFSNAVAGEYEISINILTFAASPFLSLSFAGIDMTMVDSNNYTVVTTLSQGDSYEMSGISDFADWDVDCDFFERVDANSVTFLPVTGLYKVTANFEYSYLRIEPMASTSDYASYSDGGAVWLIGDPTVGKPTLANGYSWNTDMALALAQMSSNTYQITFTAGVSMSATSINFKFFHQKGWVDEFGGGTITSNSAMITAGESDGNINLSEGCSFEVGGIYTFTLDVSGGSSAAIVTVEKTGAVEVESAGIIINGSEMTMVDLENYSLDIELTQNEVVAFGGEDMFTPAWINPDFFGSDYSLVPLSGWYRVLLNITDQTIDALPIDSDGNLKTLDDNGNGAIYFIGWGIGSPNLATQPGWTTEAGIAVPEYTDKVYVMRGYTGEDGSTTYDERFRYDYWGGKFFAERGWSGLGDFTLAAGTEALLSVASGGDLELAANLEKGVYYELTIDCTAGRYSPVVSMVKVE
ncbi:MAG: DUF5125 domain-containing protein [Rikenellaceae bacterium]